MVVSTYPVLQGRKLTVDLILSNGSPTEQNLSPYDGMQEILYKQKTARYSFDSMLQYIESQPDYNSVKQAPCPGCWVPPAQKDPSAPVLHRLEDIDASWVYKYLENVVIGYKINDGGLRQFNYSASELDIKSNGEGDEFDPQEFMLEDSGETLTLARAKARLPYLLYSLQTLSETTGVHILSLVIAYQKAKESGVDVVKPQMLLSNGVYRMNADGSVGDLFRDSANSQLQFPQAVDFITGKMDNPNYSWICTSRADAMTNDKITATRALYKGKYTLIRELLQVCDALHIGLTQEDPRRYDKEYVSNLVQVLIPKNRDYLKGRRSRNRMVMESLRAVKKEDYDLEVQVQLITDQRILEDTMAKVRNCRERVFFGEVSVRDIQAFMVAATAIDRSLQVPMAYYLRNRGVRKSAAQGFLPAGPDDLEIYEDFFYYKHNGQPLQIEVSPLTEDGVPTKALLHASGTVVMVSDDFKIRYLTVTEFLDYYQHACEGDTTSLCNNNLRFGRWHDV